MAGPQSAASRPVSPSKSRRRFTLAEANRTLPLVKRIAADVVSTHRRVGELQVKAEKSTGREQQAAQAELGRVADQLQEYVGELNGVGCELKDFQSGLVDFIGRHKGRDVCLCWRPGEEQIGFWHEVQAGFAGRQPVATLEEQG